VLTYCGCAQRPRGRPISSESDSDIEEDTKRKSSKKHVRRESVTSTSTRTRTISASPGPSGPLKRRQSSVSQHPYPKRKRSESDASNAGADAARKYCLTKLHDLFRDIFLRYPILSESSEAERIAIEKKPEDLAVEEKEQLKTKAGQFATDVEECMFELYAEPDPKGKRTVGTKYKCALSFFQLLANRLT
jgi:hypothetical protein